MLDKIIWLVIGIIMATQITKDKWFRAVLISLFIFAFIDGILWEGHFVRTFLIQPIEYLNFFMLEFTEALIVEVHYYVDGGVMMLLDLSTSPIGFLFILTFLPCLIIINAWYESIPKREETNTD